MTQQLQAATRIDPVLSRILRYTREGWPKQPDNQIRLYWSHQRARMCLLGNSSTHPEEATVSSVGRATQGISRMKASVARGYFWWSGLDQEIADVVAEC